jgi:cysteinyl-tRNA synthetase, unknown class
MRDCGNLHGRIRRVLQSRSSSPGISWALVLVSATLTACTPTLTPQTSNEVRLRKREVELTGPFLEFHGSAEQLGNLDEIAAIFRVIAIDASPRNDKFTRDDVRRLSADGRNVVLGILSVGFCDRTETYWSSAPDGLLPCVANLQAQIGERDGRPQEVWMDLEDEEYQHLIGEYEAPEIERAGVDGFLLDGLEILDHGPDDPEAPCDRDCVDGGLSLLAALRTEFPKLVFVIQGGLSPAIMHARAKHVSGDHVEEILFTSLIDGVVGEEVYAPRYDAGKEAALDAWKVMGSKMAGRRLGIFTQDYVGSCNDVDWARNIAQASRSHGFIPSVGLSPVSRRPACRWGAP